MNPEDILGGLLGPGPGAAMMLARWLMNRTEAPPPAPAPRPRPQPTSPAALPTDRPTLPVSEEDGSMLLVQPDTAAPPVMTAPDETRPVGQQPVRYTRRGDGQPAFAFTVDPSTGGAVRWLPPGQGQGQAMTPGQRTILRQNPGAPAPGQLPPRSVPVPPPTPEELAEEQRAQAAQRAIDNLVAQQMFQASGAQAPAPAPVQPRAIDRLVRNPNGR